jgi:hypothetical protein
VLESIQTAILHWPPSQGTPVPHATQAAPLGPPHTASVSPGWQLPLASQHPFGQESASQTHAPATHSWPVAHARQAAPFNPHVALPLVWQMPFALQQPLGQEFASHTHTPLTHSFPAAHATHAAPLGPPHTASVSPGWQLPLASQQPFGQESASQTHAPATHSWPVAHATQAAPSAPHAAFVVGFTQVAPSQQPVGQSAGSQYAVHA